MRPGRWPLQHRRRRLRRRRLRQRRVRRRRRRRRRRRVRLLLRWRVALSERRDSFPLGGAGPARKPDRPCAVRLLQSCTDRFEARRRFGRHAISVLLVGTRVLLLRPGPAFPAVTFGEPLAGGAHPLRVLRPFVIAQWHEPRLLTSEQVVHPHEHDVRSVGVVHIEVRRRVLGQPRELNDVGVAEAAERQRVTNVGQLRQRLGQQALQQGRGLRSCRPLARRCFALMRHGTARLSGHPATHTSSNET